MTHRITLAGFLTFFLATAAIAQTTTGMIVGTISDPSQAAMPDVEVRVTSVDTGISRSVKTNAVGVYMAPSLRPGVYSITASVAGFKRAAVENITLRVDQELRWDITLQIGETSDQVTVASDSVAVGTESPSMGTVIANREIVNMPLNGRSFIQLATLSAGVISPGTAQGESTTKTYSRRTSTSVSISGQREFTSEYRFDGIPSKDRVYGPVGMQMDIDSIAEFNIQRGYASADVGLSGRINVATKAGTNQFHAAAWEFLRNEKFDARNFFSAKNLPYRQNQYGVSGGGPILKNKLFFFGDYEGLNIRQASPALGVVPTPEMLQGNFAGLKAVIDPNTGAQFDGNVIPANRISKFAKTLNQYYATPNSPGAFNRVISTRFLQDDTKYNIRLDFAPSQSNLFFARFTFSDSDQTTEGFMQYGGTQSPLKARNAVASWTHIFTPNLLNDFKVGLDRVKNFPLFPQGGTSIPNFNDVFGFKNLLQLQDCNQLPSISIASFNAPTGIGNCITLTTNDYHYIDNLSYTHGKHHFNAGFEIMRVFMRQLVANWGNGSFSFTGQYTGNALADYLLGIPTTATGGDYGRVPDRRATWPSFYVDDQIKLTKNLNLTIGLRWEYFQPLAEDRSRLVSFDPFVPGGGFLYEQGSGLGSLGRLFPPGLLYPDKNNWAPRIGIAYSPSGKMAIRSSYGIFYQEPGGNRLNTQQTGPPFVLTTSLVGDPKTPTIHVDTDGLFPHQDPPYRSPSLSSFGYDPYARTPYLQTWTLSVQRSLPGSMFLEAAYVGSKGTHLDKLDDINMSSTPPPPGFTGTIQSRRPFPDFAFVLYDQNKANSFYHSLQLTLRRQWSKGLTFMGGYTLGKSLDGDSFDNKACRCYIPGDPGKARSVFDQRQRFVFSILYALPLRFNNRIAQSVLGGWQVSGITTLQSGFPFNVKTSIDYSNRSSVFFNLPNRVCDGNLPTDQRVPSRWFDTNCFTKPAQNTLGNAGFQFLDTDGMINQDLGMTKDFHIAEPFLIQFRGEIFNIFNHPSFGAPNGTLESPVYGQVSSALPARIIQFGVRLRW